MRSLHITLTLIVLIAAITSAQSTEESVDQLYDRAQRAYFSLKADTQKSSDPMAWMQVVDSYRLIIDSYPNDPLVDDLTFITASIFNEMYLLFGNKSFLNNAVDYYQTVLRDFPQSYLLQASLFAMAEIKENHLNQHREALDTYQELVSRYPRGYKTATAKQRIAVLKKSLETSRPRKVAAESSTSRSNAKNGGEEPDENTISPAGEKKLREINGNYKASRRPSKPVIINDVRTSFGMNSGRVVIELSGEIDFSYKQLPAPNRRIYFDLDPVNLSGSKLKLTDIPIENRFLKKIRLGQNRPNVTRVVMEFTEFREFKVFTLPSPFRIVFDLYRTGRGPSFYSAGSTKVIPEKILTGADSNSDGTYSISRQLGTKIHTIVIDPGHGGREPGASGFSGLTEKVLNLDIAFRVRKFIEQEMPGVAVKFTRDKDDFVPLDQRTAKAQSMEADLFLSIHSNSTRKGRGSGIETYYMNFASDKEAEEIAAKENAYSQINQAKLTDLLKRITLTNKKEESRELARFVQNHLYRQTRPVNSYARNRGVKSAPFIVLIGVDVPSVLVEVSFINHPVEGKLLLQDSYRDRIARGITDGIKAYVESLQ